MSTQLLSTISLSQLTDLTRRYWVERPRMVPATAYKLFQVDDLTGETGNTKEYDEIDEETFARIKREGEDSALASVALGYSKTMTAKRVAMEVNITWEMRRYNRYEKLRTKLTSLSHFCPNRLDLDLSHRLSFAESTSYTDMDGETVDLTVGDGLALISSVHTLAASSTTFSNVITGNPSFSQGALEVAELQQNTQVMDHFGNRRIMNFNVIWSSDDPTTCNDIKQVLRSGSDIDAAHAGVENVYKGKYQHVILHRLATDANAGYDSTKRKRWGTCAAGEWQAYCGMFENANLKTPSSGNNGEDIHNGNWTYASMMSYGICVVSAIGINMSAGNGA